jgi:hypothetical protein
MINENGSYARAYPQKVYRTLSMALGMFPIGAFFFYCLWREVLGPPPPHKETYKLSTKIFMSTPKEFQIFFWIAMFATVTGLGIYAIWKVLAKPSVLLITSEGVEYRSFPTRKKFIAWSDLQTISFHRKTVTLSGRSISVIIPMFFHGMSRDDLLREIEQYRPDLVKKLL